MAHPHQMPPFPPPPPPQMPGQYYFIMAGHPGLRLRYLAGIPQAHVHMIYLPFPPPPGGPNWLPQAPPPRAVGHGRHQVWKADTEKIMSRPIGEDLEATEDTCNAYLKSRRRCPKTAASHQAPYLPVCKKHKAKKLLGGRCQKSDETGRCSKLIRYQPPFAELCNDHRDWDGLPCWLLKLPTELRMHIFSYLLPDKPINAWLDAPLRKDRSRCSWELMLVNKQIRDEAMFILYGSQTFTVALGRENLVMCGGIYAHDKSEWPSIMIYNPPRPRPIRTGHVPPMLKFIKHMRLQITFVNPGYPAGRPQHYPVWDESIDLYDLRDSAKALVHLLSEGHNLLSLSVVLVAQNIFARAWTNEELCRILRTVGEPLMQLRGIPKATVEAVYQIHSAQRLSLTQYFPDQMRPATEKDEVAKPGEFVLSYKYSGHKVPTLVKVSTPLVGFEEYEKMKSNFEKAASSRDEIDVHPNEAITLKRFDAFRKAYHTVEGNFRTALPRGKNWLLHRARMAREDHDLECIAKVREELEAEVKRLINAERDSISVKEKLAMTALDEFDTQIGGEKRKRDEGDQSVPDSASLPGIDEDDEDADDELYGSGDRPPRISIARRGRGGST